MDLIGFCHIGPEKISGPFKAKIHVKHLAIFLGLDVKEKLCLQWNDFKENVTTSLKELREDKDFADVTLV